MAQSQTSRFPNILILLAFAVDLITPTLIWKGLLPANIRWASEGAIALMILVIPLRMIVFNKVPLVFWLIIFISLIGICTAFFTGQGMATTLWGWWLMFQFPLVGLFAYLQPAWPKGYANTLMRACLAMVAFEVVVQIIQYRTGTIPGDQLGGTFGQNGTGNLVLFLSLIVCFAIGELLHREKWIPLALALGLGLISSILGEMKLFYIVVAALGILSAVLYILRGKHLLRLIPIIVFMSIVMAVFIPVYDAVIPGDIPFESYFTNPALLTKYLNLKTQSTSGQNYYVDLGRNLAVTYGWDKINSSPLYLILGYGLGARAESVSLGFQGKAIQEGDLGVTAGTSALVIIQETGVVGIVILTGFILAVVIGLYRKIRQNPELQSNGLRYGLIMFTLLIPLWVWYDSAWSSRVAMLLYWSTLGFVTAETGLSKTDEMAEEPTPEPIPSGEVLRA